MPENNSLSLRENETLSTVESSERNNSMISFADLIMDQSLLSVNVKLVQIGMSTQQVLENELLTALQCEV